MSSRCTRAITVQVLYIKNLDKTVGEGDLLALFTRFQMAGSPPALRLMKQGRMKGQAFVTFPGKETLFTSAFFSSGLCDQRVWSSSACPL
jgi:hypothetical protein